MIKPSKRNTLRDSQREAMLSNNHITQPKRPADLVLKALGDDAERITVKTFANLVNLYEDATVQHVSNPAQLMFAKSQLSKAHADKKHQVNSSGIVKGVNDAINELSQHKHNAKEYDVNTNSFI